MDALKLKAPSNFVIFLAGNKADLSGNRAVLCSEAEAYALENDLLFMETSAKTAVNVTEMFVIVGKVLEFYITFFSILRCFFYNFI